MPSAGRGRGGAPEAYTNTFDAGRIVFLSPGFILECAVTGDSSVRDEQVRCTNWRRCPASQLRGGWMSLRPAARRGAASIPARASRSSAGRLSGWCGLSRLASSGPPKTAAPAKEPYRDFSVCKPTASATPLLTLEASHSRPVGLHRAELARSSSGFFKATLFCSRTTGRSPLHSTRVRFRRAGSSSCAPRHED